MGTRGIADLQAGSADECGPQVREMPGGMWGISDRETMRVLLFQPTLSVGVRQASSVSDECLLGAVTARSRAERSGFEYWRCMSQDLVLSSQANEKNASAVDRR